LPTEQHPTVTGGLEATDDADTFQAPRVVSLDGRAAQEGVSVADQVALRTQDLREWVADNVVPAFLWANGVVLTAVGVLAVVDEVNIAVDWIAPADRIINSQVIMVLLGATTVQLGAIAALIARYLFPGRPS
jgi:hypothetical protein